MSDPDQIEVISGQAFIGAVMADLPVPIRSFYGTVASRATFYRWRDGVPTAGGVVKLPILDINGMDPAILPSELRAFLLKIEKEAVK